MRAALLQGALLAGLAAALYPEDVVEWPSAWPKDSGPGYGGSNGAFASPFIYKNEPSTGDELWAFTLTGFARSGVVVDGEGRMYVAATASGDDAFPYIYSVDISDPDNVEYLWLESLDTTGSSILGAPLLSYEDDQRVLYVAATTSGTATLSDNTYVYAFATDSNQTSPDNRRTDMLWTYPPVISAAYSDVGEIRGTGAVHRNGTVMFGTAARGHPDFGGSSGVLALDRGEVRWKFATADPVTTSLIVDGGSLPGSCCDQVYFVSGDGASSTATLHAVDVYSGVQQWSATLEASENLDDPPTAPPSFGGHDDILVGFGDKMYSFNKADGAPNWVESISEAGAFVAAPACFEDDLYIGNNGGQLFHLKVEEDNSGLSLSPSKPGKHVESEMTRTMSQLLSSPVIFGGGEGVLQVDYNGLMVAFSMSGKKELWRYNFGTTMADRRQPAMTRNGEILIGAQNTILAIGGQGGCMMGYKTHDVYDMNEAQPDYFCEICGSGNMSERVGSSECERCRAGKWSKKEGATFCYKCSEPEWCPGGARCVEGNEGTMCAACVKGYYLLFTDCVECPRNPFVYTLALVAGLITLMMLYMHLTRGTKFAYEVAKDDIVAIYVNNGSRCERCCSAVSCGLLGTTSKRVECKVTRVIDDYSLEVLGNFGNSRKIKDVPFWLIKCRVYGDEVRKQGSGRVTIAPSASLLDDEVKARLKEAQAQGVMEEESADAGGRLDLGALMRRDIREELGLDSAAVGENRSIVHGKTQSAGVEVIMAASLIMVGYAQSTSLFVDIPLSWPYFFTRIFGVLGRFLTFDLGSLAISPDCDWHWSYMRKWYTAMMLPMVLASFLVLQYQVYEACVPHILIRKQMQNKVINTSCIMMVLLYVFVTAKTIEPYDCTEWQDGSRTLNKDPDIECRWTQNAGTEFTSYAGMALLGTAFFIFYGVGIPSILFSMLYTAKVNHTMGSVMTKEKFGWIYIRFTYEFYFWEIVIMFRKFVFVLVVLLAETPRSTLSYCIVANLLAMMLQYYYRPFNCFDCLLSRSRRCTHWGAMDQLEVGLLGAQLVTLAMGIHIVNSGTDEAGPPRPGEPLATTDLIMLGAVGVAGLLAVCVISYLYIKTYLLRNKMRNAGDKNEYQTAQNMQAINTDAADFFCGC